MKGVLVMWNVLVLLLDLIELPNKRIAVKLKSPHKYKGWVGDEFAAVKQTFTFLPISFFRSFFTATRRQQH